MWVLSSIIKPVCKLYHTITAIFVGPTCTQNLDVMFLLILVQIGMWNILISLTFFYFFTFLYIQNKIQIHCSAFPFQSLHVAVFICTKTVFFNFNYWQFLSDTFFCWCMWNSKHEQCRYCVGCSTLLIVLMAGW